MRGHIVQPEAGVGGWLSESENEDGVASDRYGSEEESDSLESTSRRLIQSSDGTYEQLDEAHVESEGSEFQFEVENLFPRLIPE